MTTDGEYSDSSYSGTPSPPSGSPLGDPPNSKAWTNLPRSSDPSFADWNEYTVPPNGSTPSHSGSLIGERYARLTVDAKSKEETTAIAELRNSPRSLQSSTPSETPLVKRSATRTSRRRAKRFPPSDIPEETEEVLDLSRSGSAHHHSQEGVSVNDQQPDNEPYEGSRSAGPDASTHHRLVSPRNWSAESLNREPWLGTGETHRIAFLDRQRAQPPSKARRTQEHAEPSEEDCELGKAPQAA